MGGAELADDQVPGRATAIHPRSYRDPRASHPMTMEARFRNRCKDPRRSERRQHTGKRPVRSGTDLDLVLRMRAAAASRLADSAAADRTADLRSKTADRRLVLRNRRPDLAAKWAAVEEVDLGCSSRCPAAAEATTTTGSSTRTEECRSRTESRSGLREIAIRLAKVPLAADRDAAAVVRNLDRDRDRDLDLDLDRDLELDLDLDPAGRATTTTTAAAVVRSSEAPTR